MKFGVVVFPGSNCDEDIYHVLTHNLGLEAVKLWHKETDLQGCDFIVLPGGFSYGDYLRSGAIARFSPIMNEVIKHANAGGYLMGICNGFQILVEAQLLPGALLHNNGQKFICNNVYLKPAQTDHPITAGLNPDKAYKIPIAHGEGRYFGSKQLIEELEANNQVLFRYCTSDGLVNEAANPNGSIHNIAGIANKKGNVFGMMPHPERAADKILQNTAGLDLFHSLLGNLKVAETV